MKIGKILRGKECHEDELKKHIHQLFVLLADRLMVSKIHEDYHVRIFIGKVENDIERMEDIRKISVSIEKMEVCHMRIT